MNNAELTKEWYVTHEGKQFGPVAFEDLKYEAERGKLNPRLDMVWKAGMTDWIAAGDLEGLFEKNEEAAVTEKANAASTPSPYQPEESKSDRMKMRGKWGGTSRTTYLFVTYLLPVLLLFGLPFGTAFFAEKIDQNIIGLATAAIFLGLAILALFVSINRFPNLGMSRWWWFGTLVPVLGFWVQYRLTACPEGYADHKKLDVLGWALAVVYWLVVLSAVFAIASLAFYAIQSPEEFKSLKTPEEMAEYFRKNFEAK